MVSSMENPATMMNMNDNMGQYDSSNINMQTIAGGESYTTNSGILLQQFSICDNDGSQ